MFHSHTRSCTKRLLTEREIRKPDPVLLNFIALRVNGYREDRQTLVSYNTVINLLWGRGVRLQRGQALTPYRLLFSLYSSSGSVGQGVCKIQITSFNGVQKHRVCPVSISTEGKVASRSMTPMRLSRLLRDSLSWSQYCDSCHWQIGVQELSDWCFSQTCFWGKSTPGSAGGGRNRQSKETGGTSRNSQAKAGGGCKVCTR